MAGCSSIEETCNRLLDQLVNTTDINYVEFRKVDKNVIGMELDNGQQFLLEITEI